MAGNFTSPDGDLGSIFVDDYAMIDQFAMTGSLWNWGSGSYGALGDNTITSKSSPVQTVAGGTNWKSVSRGGQVHTAALKTDGTLWLWGYNFYGQLGNNTITNKSSPVQTVAGGTNWKQVICGQGSAYAIKTDGTLWTWGQNDLGQLGVNNTTNYSSPVQTVAGGTNWKSLGTTMYNCTAIKTDGTLWLWGYNNYGQLGTNDTTNYSSPVQTVAGGTNWKQVSGTSSSTAAIKTDGTLWTWGQNDFGQLGVNTRTHYSSPVQTVAGGTNWKQVACGSQYITSIKTDGTLWTWGRNLYAQLGTNDTTHRSSPVQTVAGGTNWKQVACGSQHTAAIKTDGTLWGWGYNVVGQLADNTIVNKSSPIQTIAGGTNWKQVGCGVNHTTAITFSNLQ